MFDPEGLVGALGHIDQDVLNIFLAEAADLLGQWDEACCMLEKGGDTREALLWLMRSAQSLRRASRGVGLDDFAHALASSEELIRELLRADLHPHKTIIDALALAHTTLGRWLVGVRMDPDYVEDVSALSDAVRICRSGLQKAIEDAKYLTASRLQAGTSAVSGGQFADVQNTLKAQVTGASPARIEELIDAVGRLSTQHGILVQGSRHNERDSVEFLAALENSQKLLTDLQSRSVRLRMIPVAKLFERLSDFALDLSEDRRIAMQFDCEGQDVELDVALVEGLWRPLSNLIQIAFDFNFDTPEERIKTGKLPSLVMKLCASSENGIVTVSMDDDGKGISENDSSQAGLSFKSELEKVRCLLNSVAGSLTASSSRDKSGSFRITLPESPRLMDLVIVSSQEQSFAVPNHVIDETIEPGVFHTHVLRGDKQFIEHNSKIYPFVMINELLDKNTSRNMPRVQASLAIERSCVLLVRCGRDPIALGVDCVVEKLRSVVNPLSPHLQNVRGLSGTIMRGNDSPILFLDLLELSGAFWSPKSDREAA